MSLKDYFLRTAEQNVTKCGMKYTGARESILYKWRWWYTRGHGAGPNRGKL